MKEIKKFFRDKNIAHYKDSNNNIHITIEPYNREITTRYANGRLEKIKQLKNDLLEYFNTRSFILTISSHNIDGLYETNSLLINESSKAYSNY